MADTHSIHLVRTPQAHPKPQPLDPADIAGQVLGVVRECTEALNDFQEYQEHLIGQMGAQLNHLEVVALRAMTRKARRS